MIENLLTVEQAAQRLKIAPNTVRLHLSRGLLRGKKQGRQWRVFESALTEVTIPQEQAPPREIQIFAVQGSLTEALARITGARTQLTTGHAMNAAQDIAMVRGDND